MLRAGPRVDERRSSSDHQVLFGGEWQRKSGEEDATIESVASVARARVSVARASIRGARYWIRRSRVIIITRTVGDVTQDSTGRDRRPNLEALGEKWWRYDSCGEVGSTERIMRLGET